VKVITKHATRVSTLCRNPRAFLPNLSAAWPYGLLFLLVLVFLWPMFFGEKLPFMRDMFFDFLPQHSFAKQVFWSGQIPLWSSHSGCGKPFAADPQTATFYPLHAVFYLFSASTALRIYCGMHLWVAGAGMFALARHWRMDVAPALVTALSCMFSSWLIANLEFANNLAAAVWAPLIVLTLSQIARTLLAEDVWRQKARVANLTLILALLLAVQYLSGFPEFVVYTGILAVTYVVAVCLFHRAFRALATTLLSLAAAGMLAILLAAPQLLLSLEFVPLSERAAKIDPGVHIASLQLHNLSQFVLPFINGRPGYPEQFWAGTVFEFWLGTCYVGILPLILVCFSMLAFRREDLPSERKFLCAFLLGALTLGILMALGGNTPLYQFFYSIVPGFDRFRFPSKFLVLVLFAVSLLAGLGWQEIHETCKSQAAAQRLLKIVLVSGGLTIAVFGCGYVSVISSPWFFRFLTNGLFPTSEHAYRSELNDYMLALTFLAASVGVILALIVRRERWTVWLAPALVFTNLFFVTRGLHPMADQSVYRTKPENMLSDAIKLTNWRVHSVYGPVQQWLYASGDDSLIKWAISAGVGDSWLRFGIDQTWQGGQKLERYFALYYLLWSLPPAQSEKLADLLSVRYALVGAPFDQIYRRGASRNLQLVERPTARPRAFLVADWVRAARVDDTQQAVSEILRKMLAPNFNAAHTAVVESAISGASSVEASIPEPTAANGGGAGQVYSVQDTVNEVIVHVMAERKALLVLSDAWYPGWIALVDGIAKPIFRTNFHFRGVFLEAGEHELHFVFAPQRFRIGLWIASLTIALMGALFGFINRLTTKS
jgi:hypothetical protein